MFAVYMHSRSVGQYCSVLKENLKQWKHLFFYHHHSITPQCTEAAIALAGNSPVNTCTVSAGQMTTACSQIHGHRRWHQCR